MLSVSHGACHLSKEAARCPFGLQSSAIVSEQWLVTFLADPGDVPRMGCDASEATGRPASTLPRLLKFIPGEGGFEHGPDKPLEGGLVIVDEVSMLDAALARRLVDAVAAPTRLALAPPLLNWDLVAGLPRPSADAVPCATSRSTGFPTS